MAFIILDMEAMPSTEVCDGHQAVDQFEVSAVIRGTV
jgi:hypothetical protein